MPLLQLTPRAERDLKALPHAERVRSLEALDRLKENPGLGKALRGEFAGRRSFRVGNYRIVYRIADSVVVVNAIGHRSTVYRQP